MSLIPCPEFVEGYLAAGKERLPLKGGFDTAGGFGREAAL
jgi:hypothetical protein